MAMHFVCRLDEICRLRNVIYPSSNGSVFCMFACVICICRVTVMHLRVDRPNICLRNMYVQSNGDAFTHRSVEIRHLTCVIYLWSGGDLFCTSAYVVCIN